METYSYWVVCIAAFLSSLFFSIAEGALLGFSRSKLEEHLRTPSQKDRYYYYLEKKERLLFASQALATISRVLITGAVTLIILGHHAQADSPLEGRPAAGVITQFSSGELAVVFFQTVATCLVFVVTLGALLPRAWGEWKAESVLITTLPALMLADWLMSPLLAALKVFLAIAARLCGVNEKTDDAEEIVDDIRSAAIEGEAEGVLEEHEKSMIEKVIAFKDAEVVEVMTPRTEVDALSVGMDIERAVELAIEKGHSRIPIYDESIDRIEGICYVKDLLGAMAGSDDDRPKSLREVMRKPLFIPESKRIGLLLQDFRAGHAHIAIVLDEYGGTAGLVTIEDLLEEIVGEIEDEYDSTADAPVLHLAENVVDIDARMHIDELNEVLHITVPDNGDYETVAGYLFSSFGKVPSVGELHTHENVEFTVTDADERKINRVKVSVIG